MRTYLLMLGLPDMTSDQMLVLVALSIVAAFALGWIADAILGDGLFSVFLNSMLLLAGAIVGMFVWRRLGYVVGSGTQTTAAIVATGSALAMLLCGGMLKRWI